MPSLWSATPVTGPSAGLVQRHFVDIRLKELAQRGPEYEKKVMAKLEQKLANAAGMRKSGMTWMEVFDLINKEMQRRHLTINLDEVKWFSSENKFPTYAQMYERAGSKLPSYERNKDGAEVYTLHTAGSNFAKTRADVDDDVTFPKHWKFPEPSTLRGLSPGAGLTRQRLRTQMAFDATPIVGPNRKDNPDKQSQWPSSPHFNPKTKQVFAALNYGRRPHGSAPLYGSSYLVLEDHLKINAVYYPMDTFTYQTKKGLGIKQQFPFTHLAAAIAFNDRMGDEIIKSCWSGLRLDDDLGTDMLLEAHIHGELPFAGNVRKLVLAETDQVSAVALNAKKFAKKWGAELVFNAP